MKRLSGLDAGFLYAETPSLHLHTLKIAVIDPGGPDSYTFERFRDILAARLHLLPPFRRRAVMIPFGLYHPVWVEDPDFQIDRHLSRVAVPPPGDDRQLAAVVSWIAGKPLDRTKPLWEITAVEGLAGGRVGFVAKLHHSLADGTAAAELLMNVLLADPDAPAESSIEPPPWSGDQLPSRRELIVSSARSLASQARQLPGLAVSTAKRLAHLAEHARSSEQPGAVPFRIPRAPWNAAISPNRVYASAQLPLDGMKAVRKRHASIQATLNDVYLAVCTGALRRYLASRHALPDQSLVAGVPASVGDGGDEPRLDGNRVSNMFALLPVEIDDPVERLATIRASMQVAKQRHEILGPELLERWTQYNLRHSSGTFMKLWSALKLSNRVGSPMNLVVSNVPGPRVPLYVAGASLKALYSIGPILEGIGLNITAWSYVDTMYVALLACPEHAADLWELAAAFRPALDELLGESPTRERASA